jgi:RNA polymerase sigma factor for flagellar operon FliA
MGVQNSSAKRKQEIEKTARDQIVLENLSLVKAIAVRVHENLPVHVDLDDLVHAGVLGLFDAASKYNPDKKVIFQSYAKHRIKGAILDSLRQLDWASRDLRKRQKQLESVTRDLTSRLGRTPTEMEIAENLGLGIDRWRRMALELKNLGLVSASSLRPDPDNSAPVEFPAAPDSRPDQICSRRQMRSALAVAMKCLPKRYQKVVFLYYSNEMTMKEIGDILGVNESRVSQIHKIALEKMAASLRSAGIESSGAF